jgi:radical SAM protein with 4Fe4S-binding SPASM domain
MSTTKARKVKASARRTDWPRLVAWEITKRCNLACSHCRASATADAPSGELTTAEGIKLLRGLTTVGSPLVILTGGEPLMREDVFELARAGADLGLSVALATNGSLVTDEVAEKIAKSRITRCAISIDGVTSETHDRIRNAPGSFSAAVKAASIMRNHRMPFQINTSVTRDNEGELPLLHGLVEALGAEAWHVFMVVPMGRAVGMSSNLVSATRYDEILRWLASKASTAKIEIKPTCAPQYYRIIRQNALSGNGIPINGRLSMVKGCLAGQGFAFISSTGGVQPCGYFPVVAGSLRKHTFGQIWRSSALFQQLRDPAKYKGRCARCEFFGVCGGCRARALATSGHFLDDDCYCTYIPRADLS